MEDAALNLPTNLAEYQLIVQLISNAVSNDVMSVLHSVYLKVAAGVITALISAITYMYIAQVKERKEASEKQQEANDKIYAILQESTALLNEVKNGLKASNDDQKRNRKVLEKLCYTIRNCKNNDSDLNVLLQIEDEENEL